MLMQHIPRRTLQGIRFTSLCSSLPSASAVHISPSIVQLQASASASSALRAASTTIIHHNKNESSVTSICNTHPTSAPFSKEHSATPSPSSAQSTESQSHKNIKTSTFPKRQNPPRPPGGSATLPTVDASPILAPTVYIKKTSKSVHSIAGPDATKRLLIAQHKICTWIWNQVGLLEGSNHDSNGDGDGGVKTTYPMDDESVEDDESENNSLGFMLVGHGVPYLLFQDHVDCAWDMLNNDSIRDKKSNGNESSSAVDSGEVVECTFSSDTGKLSFDWIKIRKRDNTVAKYALSNDRQSQSEQLYLAVMNRISTTLGKILLTQPLPNSPTINADRYWKKDISTPISHWRATFKRGFVYPPSATSSYSFDSCDHRGGGKGRGEYWTSPPIVELIPRNGGVHEFDMKVEEEGGNPSFVRVTLQGIPSIFWKEENRNSDVIKDDMVPVSLVFEARFEPEKRV